MGYCGSLHLSSTARLSLSHHRSFDSKKNKESYIFFGAKCFDSSFSMLVQLSSLPYTCMAI